ncbi:MAG TPA: acyl-CoA dehydrogenase family protein [Actinocrinis sp.]|nr:acyl-CoA dehydrogenase family protein [Actinocrinis sp.]
MDFGVPAATVEFDREVQGILSDPRTAELIRAVHERADGMDGDVRELYRHLGAAGILAPSWPTEYGGRGLDYTATVALLEQIVAHGIPQSLYYISVQIVGSLILQSGSEQQKQSLLPELAGGRLTMCILFTEPEYGSDLASVASLAVPDPDGSGWVIDGRKTYNLKSAYADMALCAVRTDQQTNRYQGLSLLLIPMDAHGVSVRPIRSLADEQFHDIRLDAVRVDSAAVIGSAGSGWSLITRLFAAERSGLDYYARATHWLDLVAARLGANPGPGRRGLADLARHRTRLAASRLLTCRAMQNLQEDRTDIAQASMAKWHCSDTAQRISWWSLEALGSQVFDPVPGKDNAVLEAAFREAPGLTISGGASEVLLDIVGGALVLDDTLSGS